MDLFSRQDWTLFRTIGTIGQRAGVPVEKLAAVVVKELLDNALDSAGQCRYGRTPDGGLFVQDDGDGLPGTDADVAALFSVARPLSSSKLLRLPTRGALGNGLRVVAGAVLASGGRLTVKTRGRALRLRPRDSDGGTDPEHVRPWKGLGTRVHVLLGEALPMNGHTFQWADQAAAMAKPIGQTYRGATSPWWYDSDSFYELTRAAVARTVRELVESFAGCSGTKAGDFTGRPCDSLTRGEAESLLADMRTDNRQVKPKRLGAVGPQFQPAAGYVRRAVDVLLSSRRGRARHHDLSDLAAGNEGTARPQGGNRQLGTGPGRGRRDGPTRRKGRRQGPAILGAGRLPGGEIQEDGRTAGRLERGERGRGVIPGHDANPCDGTHPERLWATWSGPPGGERRPRA